MKIETKPNYQASAISHPNIAFIKYWGNQNNDLRIAANDSISMNLGDLETQTSVEFLPDFTGDDRLFLNGEEVFGAALSRVSEFLDLIREMGRVAYPAVVKSHNDFPTGAGIASSAAAFSALALAGSAALQLNLSEKDLSRLARRGSGSASRSIPTGFVEWTAGRTDADSYAFSIAEPSSWNLVDCIAVVQSAHKTVGSTAGHALAGSSPLQNARLADAPRRVSACREAILTQNFSALAEVVELDSNMMHSVMQTSDPALLYWEPASVALMKIVPAWRKAGIPAFYTLDAGPNVHVLTTREFAPNVKEHLLSQPGVIQVLESGVGGPARLVETNK